MQITPQEAMNRLSLLDFLHCLAYLYNRHVSKATQDLISSGTKSEIQQVLPKLSYTYDISKSDLIKTWQGSEIPKRNVLYVMNGLVSDHNSLVKYIKSSSYAYHFNINKRLLNILNNDNDTLREATLLKFSKPYHLPSRLFTHAFQNAGYSIDYQQSLTCFIKEILSLKHKDFSWLAKQLGFKYTTLYATLTRSHVNTMLKKLVQLPYVLGISMNDVKDIVTGSRKPQQLLLRNLNKRIHDRNGLYVYIRVFCNFNNTTLSELSRCLGKSNSYFRWEFSHASGERLSTLLYKMAEIMCVPSAMLLSALARANVKSAKHAYQVHMRFITKYYKSPIKYHEDDYKRDQDNVRTHLASIKKILRSDNGLPNLNLEHHIHQIIFNWSYMFGFNPKLFIDDNFPNLGNSEQTTYVLQNHKATIITNHQDWKVLLRKIHYQLDKVRNAFSLAYVQRSSLGSCVYVDGVSLTAPYDDDAPLGLKPLADKGRYLFRAHFNSTDFKIIPQGNDETKEVYHPVVNFIDVTHNGKLVAKSVWLNYISGLIKLGQLEYGDLLSFTARVKSYKIGDATKYTVPRLSYKLAYPSDIKIVRRRHARSYLKVPTNPMALTGYAIVANRTEAYDFTGRNYKYARYCINRYKDWKKQQEQNN